MRLFLGLTACLLASAVGTIGAEARSSAAEFLAPVPGGYYFDPAAIDVAQLLPPPPPPDSIAGRAEIETVLQVQAARTPEQVAWAQTAEKDALFSNARVLGPWFTKENLPLTAAFFARVDADVSAVRGKELFGRKRPPYADERVRACVRVSDSASYPSGHSLRAWVWAGILAEIYPDQANALAERARAVGWGRVVGGTHFPSDIIAGQVLAKALVKELLQRPAVKAEIEKCREEAQPFLLKKAA